MADSINFPFAILCQILYSRWMTEKMKTLDFTDPSSGQIVSAKWSHLVDIFENEIKHPVKLTKLSYSTLYPTNFEKQKVSLAMNVFNEKTVTALDISNYHGTKMFVEAVTRTWHILNVNTQYDGTRLNDAYRTRGLNVNDERQTCLRNGNFCYEIYSRVRNLTADTSRALYLTLNGLVDMMKVFLSAKKFKYLLMGTIQSDRLEGEFGVLRQLSGGNYYISYEQILSSIKCEG